MAVRVFLDTEQNITLGHLMSISVAPCRSCGCSIPLDFRLKYNLNYMQDKLFLTTLRECSLYSVNVFIVYDAVMLL